MSRNNKKRKLRADEFEKIKILRRHEFQGKANVSRKKINHQEIVYNHRFVHMIENRPWTNERARVHTDLQLHPHRPLNVSAAYCSLDAWAMMPTVKHRVLMNKIHSGVNTASFGPGHEYLLSGSQNGQFTWYNKEFKFELVFAGSSDSIEKIMWDNSRNHLLACELNGKVKMYKSRALNEICEADTKVRLFDIDFSPTCGKFASVGDSIFIFDTASFQHEFTFPKEHGYNTKSVAWHPTKSLVAVCGANNGVSLIDPRGRQKIATVTNHTQNASCVVWCYEHLFASGGQDKIVSYVDIRTRKTVKSVQGAPAGITSLKLHPTHRNLLAVGCFDGSIGYLIDQEPAYMKKYHRLKVTDMQFHPAAHALVTTSLDGTIVVHRQVV